MNDEQRKLMQETKFNVQTIFEVINVSAEEIDTALNSTEMFRVLTSHDISEKERQSIIRKQLKEYATYYMKTHYTKAMPKPTDYVVVSFKIFFLQRTYSMMLKDANMFKNMLYSMKLAFMFLFVVVFAGIQQLPSVQICAQIFQICFYYYIVRLIIRLIAYLTEGK